ncbi:hypothetical protein C1Y63_07695 [Corynebacterium sp. 13CS0277]|nr:hypothetical protein C1Y63_07695 [Corynebacterium sp. 13CS0277]
MDVASCREFVFGRHGIPHTYIYVWLMFSRGVGRDDTRRFIAAGVTSAGVVRRPRELARRVVCGRATAAGFGSVALKAQGTP